MNTSPGVVMGLNAAARSGSALRGFAAGIAVLALGWPALVSADCVDTRKPTAGEMEFHSRAMAALVAALPPVPVGGKLQNQDSVTTLGQQCKGSTGDFKLEAVRYYELNYRKSIVSVAINEPGLPATDNVMSAAYGSASPKRSAALKVNNVVWRVSGSDSPLRLALVDAMDRTRLQALVGKPLPSVAESQALVPLRLDVEWMIGRHSFLPGGQAAMVDEIVPVQTYRGKRDEDTFSVEVAPSPVGRIVLSS